MTEIAGFIELYWQPVLLWLIAGSAVIFSLISMRWITVLRADFEYRLAEFEKQLKVVVSGAVGMGERMVKLDAEIKKIQDNQAQAVEAEANYSYSQAVKLIEQGVDSSTVAASCGLSDCEIQLMELVHKKSGRLAAV